MRYHYLSFLFLMLLISCTDRSYVYEVETLSIEPNNAEKDKEKTTEQYLNIVYANLFQTALSPNQLVDMTETITSIGDKQLAYETILAKLITDPSIAIPSNEEMRADLDLFISDTYKRFLVRLPSEAEKSWWKNYIKVRPNLTPDLVYFAFASSNEYYYY